MKFQPDTLAGVNAIGRLDGGRLWVGTAVHEGSVVVPWSGAVQPWDAQAVDALDDALVQRLLALEPEVVIVGSGARLRFVPPAVLAPLFARRIGVETMDTGAACRTYNVLVSEGRRVVAALVLPA